MSCKVGSGRANRTADWALTGHVWHSRLFIEHWARCWPPKLELINGEQCREDLAPPASSVHMKEQTCFIKHMKTNTQGRTHTPQRRLCEHEHRETHRGEVPGKLGVTSGCSLTLLNYAFQSTRAEHAQLSSVSTGCARFLLQEEKHYPVSC